MLRPIDQNLLPFGLATSCAFTLMLGLLLASHATAQTTERSEETREQVLGFRGPTNLPNQIREDNEDKDSRLAPVFGQNFLERWTGFKNSLYDRTGIKFSVAYAYVYQHGSSSSVSINGSGGQFETNFTWDVFGQDGTGMKGLVGGKLENRHEVFADITPQFVAPLAGSIWSGAPGYGTQNWSLPELWYEHHFVRDRVLVRVGKMIPFAVFDYYKYKSPRTGFLGQPQNVNPTIAYPPSALGVGGGIRMTNGVYAAGGVFDANGSPTKAGFDTLFDTGELFTIVDLGWTPDFVEGNVGRQGFIPGNEDYHLTIWHSDARQSIGRPEGWGFTVSAQKGFGKVVPFLRYGYSDGGATPLEHMLNFGIGFDDVFGYDQDTIGVGLTWGAPSNAQLRDQYAAEAYYKIQLTPHFAVTTDVQLIANPANDTTTDFLGLFSVRGRLAL